MKNGIVQIAYGQKALEEHRKNFLETRKFSDLPCTVIGNGFVPMELEEAPEVFVGTGPTSFRAGNIKPFLYNATPYQNTLYMDVDTVVLKDISEGFEFLKYYDICVSYHVKPSGDEWYVDEIFGDPQRSAPVCASSIKERDMTQSLIGERMPFINTGVIFFRQSDACEELFRKWHEEWMIFHEWDEQMAFHRAIARTDGLKVLLLPPKWNQKYPDENTIILHGMGKGAAREGKK